MAHTCPECGQACYCGGDIDDCLSDFEEDVINCVHYLKCQQEQDDDNVVESDSPDLFEHSWITKEVE